jgi:hypothetical protein
MTGNLIPIALVGGGVAYVLSRGSGVAVQPGPNPYGGGYYDPYLDDSGQAAFNIDGRLTDPDARQKLDLLNLALEKGYSAMSNAAKVTAADQMNSRLNLDPPLKGNESWEQVARIAGGAVGAAGCSAIAGIGAAIAPLCAMAGSYLGVQLENWMQSELPGLKEWVSGNLGAVVDTIGDKISDWFHDIF